MSKPSSEERNPFFFRIKEFFSLYLKSLSVFVSYKAGVEVRACEF